MTKKNQITIICELCKKIFTTNLYNFNHGKKFCSRICLNQSPRIRKQRKMCHFGKKKSEESRKKMSDSQKILFKKTKRKFWKSGPENHNWKGDNAGRVALHAWAKRQLKPPKKCFHCGKRNKKIKNGNDSLDCANISHMYLREKTDWMYLCRPCHYKYDEKDKILRTMKRDYHGRLLPKHISK